MSRLVSAGAIIYDQPDIYSPVGTINRPTGLVFSNFTLTQLVNGAALPWPLADGSSVPDSSISSGTVYLHEISGSPGFYSVRFLPDRVGFWKLILTNAGMGIDVVLEYDVLASGALKPGSSSGLVASFTKQ